MFALPKVVVLGGGFGGLETVFYLRHKLGPRVDLTLVSDSHHFTFKPGMIYIPFGEDPAKLQLALDAPLKRKNIRFVHGIALEIDPVAQRVETSHGPIFYDYLVVATGAGVDPIEIPGFKDHAHTLWTVQQMLRLGDALERLLEVARSGEKPRLLFVAPQHTQCITPLYEMALMTESWLTAKGLREDVELTWATAESRYLEAFGPRLHPMVEQEFDRRRIDGFTGQTLAKVEPNAVHFANRGMLPFDLLVSMPPTIAMQRFTSLPTDDRGFVQVDADSRRVLYQNRIYAVGDSTDFPVKQAVLALLQADAAADHIAAEILGVKPTVQFQPISTLVMEQFDQATFMQVPFKYVDPANARGGAAAHAAVEVDPEAARQYQLGVSPLWRFGKKVMSLYLPWRFGNGEPFHAGLTWNAINLSLNVAKKFLAS